MYASHTIIELLGLGKRKLKTLSYIPRTIDCSQYYFVRKWKDLFLPAFYLDHTLACISSHWLASHTPGQFTSI